jgi:rubrerythrin
MAATLVALATFSASAAPKKKKGADEPKDLASQQLDYAKQLYGEGMTAMEAKDYSTAVVKFKEAYRYAPDKHLFTYNIASAAELAGDCQGARTYYQMFVDLVPEHPEHATAEKTLKRLNEECASDPETVEKVTVVDKKERAKERSAIEAENALQAALDAARKGARMYAEVAGRNGGAQPFKRTAAAKKRHVKRILKLFASHDVEPRDTPEGGDDGEAFVPDSLGDACRAGASLEKKTARVYEDVIGHFDTREMYRVMNRLSRQADNRLRPAFQESCPKK